MREEEERMREEGGGMNEIVKVVPTCLSDKWMGERQRIDSGSFIFYPSAFIFSVIPDPRTRYSNQRYW
jgi:hypothetical protein